MGKVPIKTRQYTIGASVLAVIIVVGLIAALSWSTLITYLNEIFFVSTLVILVPSAILDFKHQRWISSIEDQMPLLVRGVAESQETGMTLIRALEKVVDNKMVSGPLSKEVKQLVIEMSWGTSFEDALTTLQEPHKLTHRKPILRFGFGSQPFRRHHQEGFYCHIGFHGGNERN